MWKHWGVHGSGGMHLIRFAPSKHALPSASALLRPVLPGLAGCFARLIAESGLCRSCSRGECEEVPGAHHEPPRRALQPPAGCTSTEVELCVPMMVLPAPPSLPSHECPSRHDVQPLDVQHWPCPSTTQQHASRRGVCLAYGNSVPRQLQAFIYRSCSWCAFRSCRQLHPVSLSCAAARRQVFREVRALVAPVVPDRSGTKFPVLPQVSACRI